MLLLLSGCADSGSAVVIRASAGMETIDPAEEETGAGSAGWDGGQTAANRPDSENTADTDTAEAVTAGQAVGGSGTVAETVTGIVVHICGQVENPGVYELPAGSRVWDGVQAAGGFSEGADPEGVNLAAALADGCKVTIPSLGETVTGEADWYEAQAEGQAVGQSASTGSENTGGAGSLIDINRASVSELTAIPGIGEVRAAAIVAYRETYGPFRTIEEIMNVTGIKEGLFEKMKGYITAGG